MEGRLKDLQKAVLPKKFNIIDAGKGLKICVFFDVPEWILTDEVGIEVLEGLSTGLKTSDIASNLVENKGLDRKMAEELLRNFMGKISRMNFSKETVADHEWKPNALYIEVTSQCNLACPYCYIRGGPDQKDNCLTYSEIKRIIHEASDLGCKELLVSGGEPFLYKKLFDVINAAKDVGYEKVGIFTNATLIDRQIARKLKDFNIQVFVSLEGSKPKIHDQLRGPGAFRRAMKGIKALRLEKVEFSIEVTILKPNLDDCMNSIELAQSLRAKKIHFIIPMPIGRLSDNLDIVPSVEDLVGFEKRLLNHQREFSMKGRKLRVEHFALLLKGLVAYCPRTTKCSEHTTIHVSSDGGVTPCLYLKGVAGNIRSKSLSEIVWSSPIYCLLRKETLFLIESCRSCSLKLICGGGCRSRSYLAHGDFLKEDPYCALLRNLIPEAMVYFAEYPKANRNLLSRSLVGGNAASL